MCLTSTGAWEKFINYEDKISMLKSSSQRYKQTVMKQCKD